MNLGRIACERFARLSEEAGDRPLRRLEQRFVDRHRDACPQCRAQEVHTGDALNMLRGIAFQDEDVFITPGFDDRIIRQVKVNTVRDGFRYWSPAAFGAVVAMCAIFAAMHVASTPASLREANVPGGQVRNTAGRPIPNLELDKVPDFRR